MDKKERVIEFLKLVSSGNVEEAFEKYVHADFIHHNVYFPGDRVSLMNAMKEAAIQSPNIVFEIKQVFEHDDLIAIHSYVEQENGTEIAVVHTFRFQDDKIVELWDIGMVVPKDSPNEHGVF